MPTKQLKVLAKEAGKSIEEAEQCWEKAKKQADKVYPKGEQDPNYWGFVVNSTKKCLKIDKDSSEILNKINSIKNKYKEIKLTEENISKYKDQYYGLSHIRTGEDYTGVMLIDKGDKFVAVLSINKKEHNIQGLDIKQEYRSQGISVYLLDLAVKEYKVTNLTVRETNTKAIKIYKKFGFVETKKEGIMLHMKYKPNKKTSLEDW